MKYEIINSELFTVFEVKETHFDAKLAPFFRHIVADLHNQFRPVLLIDLSNVSFMDSSGLGAIMEIYKLLRDKELMIVGASTSVNELMHLTRMDKLMPSFFSIEEAMRAAIESDIKH
ncbi:STAS domain-containing protein [Vibrio sp. ZSDZ34]|jgi:anti-sigma B factor antagonist|uniref:STAS domain-containing protein n=1 Tax=Vibrio gelatinilyticus TaxID=2893468 RepID=A0A9X1W6P7_9VIBR|nr:STAS domain-containing protein [Vibrio gelatinilyticus]MCJ2375232.1 STAS domain-containing protein [Vibrio gelatinilyticus]